VLLTDELVVVDKTDVEVVVDVIEAELVTVELVEMVDDTDEDVVDTVFELTVLDEVVTPVDDEDVDVDMRVEVTGAEVDDKEVAVLELVLKLVKVEEVTVVTADVNETTEADVEDVVETAVLEADVELGDRLYICSLFPAPHFWVPVGSPGQLKEQSVNGCKVLPGWITSPH